MFFSHSPEKRNNIKENMAPSAQNELTMQVLDVKINFVLSP